MAVRLDTRSGHHASEFREQRKGNIVASNGSGRRIRNGSGTKKISNGSGTKKGNGKGSRLF